MYRKILAVVAILAPGLAWGQTYPSPHLNNVTVDGTITGGVISGANASGANVTATGGVVNTLSTWMQGLFTGWGTTLYCSNYASPQACHDALPSTGGKMMMAANTTYSMTSRLNISKPNVVLECPSWNTIFQRASAYGQQLVYANGTGDVVKNCTFDGNGTVYTGISYAEMQISSANGLAEHNNFVNAGGNIMLALSGANSRATGNTLTGLSLDNNQYGIWANGHVTVTIDNNTVTGSGIDGIGFDGDGSKVQGNRLSGNHCGTGSFGGQIVQYGTGTSHNEIISGNAIGQGCIAGSHGIEIGGGSEIQVINNSVLNQLGNGIYVDPNVSGVLIADNTIVNSGLAADGVNREAIPLFAGANHIKVTGNRIIDNQGSPTQLYGVYIFGGSGDFIQVSNNDFTGTPTPIVNATSGQNIFINNNTGIGLNNNVAGSSDNRVRNPCGEIDQNLEGGTYASAGGNTFVADGYVRTSSSGAFSVARSTATPAPGCGTSLHLIQVTQRNAPTSGQFYLMAQSIMGSDLQDFNWGTAMAKPAMVDFCVKSSVAGTYPFVIRLSSPNVYYATTYTILANTLSCQSIQIPALVGQTIADSNAAAVVLQWDMGSGSSQLTSTLNAWTSGALTTGIVGATAFAAQTAGATFDLTAIRFYPSQGDMPWAPRTNLEELNKARQFYQKSFPVGTAVAQNAGATGSVGFTAPYAQATFGTVSLPIGFAPMRAAPAVVFYSPSAASANCYDTTRAADAGAAAATNIGTTGLTATCTLVAGDLLGDLLNVHYTLDARL